jgi:hypothetical protein
MAKKKAKTEAKAKAKKKATIKFTEAQKALILKGIEEATEDTCEEARYYISRFLRHLNQGGEEFTVKATPGMIVSDDDGDSWSYGRYVITKVDPKNNRVTLWRYEDGEFGVPCDGFFTRNGMIVVT